MTVPTWTEEEEGALIVELALKALTDARTDAMKSDSVFVEVRGDQLVRVQHGRVLEVVGELPTRSTSPVRRVGKLQPRLLNEACNGVIETRTTPTSFWTDALQFSDPSPEDEAG